jgi:glutathione S-transferase
VVCLQQPSPICSVLEQHLTSRQYLLGDHFTLADISPGVQAARVFENNGWDFNELKITQFPALQEWYKKLKDRPAFKKQVLPYAQQ